MSSLFVLVAVLVVVVSGQRTFRYDGTVVDQSGSSQLFRPQAPVVLMQQPQDQNSGPVVFLEQTPLDDQGPVFPFQSRPQVFVEPIELEEVVEPFQPQVFDEAPVFEVFEPRRPQVLEQVQPQVFVEPETVFSQPDVFFMPSQPVSTRPDVVVLPQQQVQPTVFISPQTFSPSQTGQSVFVSSPQPQPTVTVSQPQQVGSVFQPQPTVTVSQPQQVGSVFQPQQVGSVFQPQPTVTVSQPQQVGSVFQPQQVGSVFQPQPTVTVSQPQQVGSVFQPQQVGSVFQPQVGSVFQPQPTVTVSQPQSFQSSFVSGVSSVTVSGQCNIVSGSLVDQVVGREVWHFSWCHQASRTYTWYQARDYCTSLGQGFASISVENQIKNNVLSAVMSAHGQRTTWTSGNRLTTKRWSWSKAGVQSHYTNWARTGRLGRPQPDNADGDELCLCVNNSYTEGAAWHDASCSDLSPVVCQATAA
ncbi:hypothetical protein Pcinc_031510 [Petrolisthes cinctipes]|uniref:C-type lectin domain-containing protein n=1 Tax=Petrolisthes cinctipes TaxID=88211 RepID=A0AAE1EWI4_PETCI|nr:hypothetical protein Pcinc_031510 [Petrolisthes cinctipes]